MKRKPYTQVSQDTLRRRVAGQKAKAAGRKFENELEFSLTRYGNLCCMTRSHPPVAGPPGRMFITGRGSVDFVGLFQGVPVAFDAKSMAQLPMSWSVPDRDMHEVRFLKQWVDQGGLAFVLIRSGDTAYVVTYIDTLANGGAVILREKGKVVVPRVFTIESKLVIDDNGEQRTFWPIHKIIQYYHG